MENESKHDKRPRTLLYQVVIDDIMKRISNGEFSFDIPICTETKLMEQYGISRITARRAMTDLEAQGVLYRKRGVGSFVSRDIYAHREEDRPGSKLFAFIFPFNISRTGLMAACQAANTMLMSREYYASTFITEDSENTNGRSMLAQLKNMDTAGLAYYPKTANYHLNLITQFVFQGKPVVIIDVPSHCPYVSSVTSDNIGGSQLLMEHLYALGHRAIGYISGIGPEERPTICDRLSGYMMFHEKVKLPLQSEFVITDMTEERRAASSAEIPGLTQLQEAIVKLKHRGVTAILAEHDQLAFEMVIACRDIGVNIPGDLSICGFDDSEWAHLLPGNITSIRQNMEQIGHRVAHILLNGQSKPLENVQHVVMPTELVVGTTTGPAPRA